MSREGTEQQALVSEVPKPSSMLLLYLTCSHCVPPLTSAEVRGGGMDGEEVLLCSLPEREGSEGPPSTSGALGDADTMSWSRVGRCKLTTSGVLSLSESVRNM